MGPQGTRPTKREVRQARAGARTTPPGSWTLSPGTQYPTSSYTVCGKPRQCELAIGRGHDVL